MEKSVEKHAGRVMNKGWYRLYKTQIGYLRFILEGYDGLGFARTLDAAAGLVEVSWPASRDAEMGALLAALEKEIALQPVARPESRQAL